MTLGLLALALPPILIALGRWRWGLLLCPVVGMLQDPVRKLLPSRPVAVVVIVVAVLIASLVSALARGNAAWIRGAARVYHQLKVPIVLFTLVVVVQSVRSLAMYGSWTMAAIGLLGYLSPMAAIGTFYLLAREWRDVRKWLRVYVAVATAAGLTVVLHFLGVTHRLFDSIALDTVYGVGVRVQMYCGVYRGSELAAFHSATAACLALAWASNKRGMRVLLPAGLVIGLLSLAVVVTGRRKMLAQMLLFVVIFLAFEARSRIRGRQLITVVAMLGIAFGTLLVAATSEGTAGSLSPYLIRSRSVFGESFDRLHSMTTGAFSSVLANVGPFGVGAGTVSQGSQYLGGDRPLVWANTEGGLGRVLAELGLPGLLLLAALAWALTRSLLRAGRFAATSNSADSPLILGMIAILPSNAAVFASAQQLYGDPFVLIVLGALVGFALGFPVSVRFAGRDIGRDIVSAVKDRTMGAPFRGPSSVCSNALGNRGASGSSPSPTA